MNLNEAVDYLHELMEEVDDTEAASLYIEPPDDANKDLTDEDSADEGTYNIHNMSRTQLLAPAAVITSLGDNGDSEHEDEDANDTFHETYSEPPYKKIKTMYCPSWTRNDLEESNRGHQRFPWTAPAPKLPSHDSQSTLFEILFTDELIEFICEESNKYATMRGREASDTGL